MKTPKPKKEAYIQFRVSQQLKDDAEELAIKRNTSVSQLLTDFLTREIKAAK